MNCQQCHDHLMEYLLGELDPATHRKVEAALEMCPDCQAELASLERIQRATLLLPRPEPSARVGQSILRQARLAAAERSDAARSAPVWLVWAGPTLGFALALLAVGVGIRSFSGAPPTAPVASSTTAELQEAAGPVDPGFRIAQASDEGARDGSVAALAPPAEPESPSAAAAPAASEDRNRMAALPTTEEVSAELQGLPDDLAEVQRTATNARRAGPADEGRANAGWQAADVPPQAVEIAPEPGGDRDTRGAGISPAATGSGGVAREIAAEDAIGNALGDSAPGFGPGTGSVSAAPPVQTAAPAAAASARPSAAPAPAPVAPPAPGPAPAVVAEASTYASTPAADNELDSSRAAGRERREGRAESTAAGAPLRQQSAPGVSDSLSAQSPGGPATEPAPPQEEAEAASLAGLAAADDTGSPEVESLLLAGRVDEALALATARLQLERSVFNVYWAGRAWLEAGDEPRALDMLEELMQRFPSDARVTDLHDRVFSEDRPATRSRMRRSNTDEGF